MSAAGPPAGSAEAVVQAALPEPATSAWLAAQVPGLRPPLAFHLIAGGVSNLTFRVTDAGGRHVVLRRPPLGELLATAHDVLREARIFTALAGTGVPVPPVLAVCPDAAVLGVPFFVTDFVEGPVLRGPEDAAGIPDGARRAAAEDAVRVLVALHRLDVDALGLGDLGRRSGYVERQLRRWHRQWEQSRSRDLPLVDAVHARLRAALPPEPPPALVHGDYKLDNLILAPTGTVRAVLDWELATIGDPLADLGTVLAYWGQPGEGWTLMRAVPTVAPGFPDRAWVARRYAELSGLDLDVVGLDYYVALAHWKIACIVEGVLARARAGAMGAWDEEGLARLADHVEARAEAAAALVLPPPP